MTHLYLMPGMGANPLIFKKLYLGENYSLHYLEWIEPQKDESLKDYCKRLINNISHPNPVLIGVSFGGIIVQEIAKIIPVKKVIIISSVKTNQEFPPYIKIANWLKLQRIFPAKLVNKAKKILKEKFFSEKNRNRMNKFLTVNSDNYLQWAVKQVVEWKNPKPIENIIHIHGTNDFIFPHKYIKNAHFVNKATHLLVITHYHWLNTHLPYLLNNES